MRIVDLAGLALKNLKGRWPVLPIAGVAISAFCLCFSGAILTAVQHEKALPCEIAVTVRGNAVLSDSTIADLSEIESVTAVTPLLQIPVTIQSGPYTAQMALIGIDAAYLEDPFTKGRVFPDSTVMPYIVLNETACKQFSDGKEKTGMGEYSSNTAPPNIDWLNAGFTLLMSEGTRPIISKVCGVLAGKEGQEPAAYVSLSTAKGLLYSCDQETAYMAANVRAVNIGVAANVSRATIALGFTVGNTNGELQARWDAQMKEMGYLAGTGVFGLLCSLVLLSAWRKTILLEHRESWTMLHWLGMRNTDTGRLFLLQAVIISMFGAAIGILSGLALPAFLPPELKGVSIFMLPIPAGVAAASTAVCTVSGLLSILISTGPLKS